MIKRLCFLGAGCVLLAFVALADGAAAAAHSGSRAAEVPVGDWPDWRGPNRDGVSMETGLVDSWSPSGENVAWTAPFGGRSAPVVFGDRLYVLNGVGEGAERQERIVALDSDTGQMQWEYRFNVTLSDAPPRRVGWSAPVVDRVTGNIYALGVSGTLLALNPDGELLWERYLSEQFGLVSTHGGRTVSPILDGGHVIVGGVTAGWGSLARGMHRFLAFDQLTGQTAWVSSTGTRAFDTTFSTPIVREIGGQRLVIGGAGDGAVHGYQASTGQLVWRFPMTKRGINTGVVVLGDTAFVSHGEENLDGSEMGMVAAIDATGSGELAGDDVLWSRPGLVNSYSSPVLDGDRFYQIDNGANLVALDTATGELLWRENLGTIQRAGLVLADGKLYVGTQNGTFFILRPSAQGVEILDRDELTNEGQPDEIIAAVAVARGHVYLVTHSRIYAIGNPETITVAIADPFVPQASTAEVARVQVFPQELVLSPGDEVAFEARRFDAAGERVDTVRRAEWSVSGVGGEIDAEGHYVAAGTSAAGGAVTVKLDGIEASARLRVLPPLPWNYDFDDGNSAPSYWIAAGGKFRPEAVDGGGVLVKTNDNPFLKRTKVFMGATDMHDYTVQVDFSTAVQRRRMGDAGLIAQRYALIVFGTKQRVELQSWQPETERTVVAPLTVAADQWYRIKLRTENLADGVLVQAKVWPRADPEPAEWTVEKTDRVGGGNRYGSPGLYADAHAVVTFDNLSVEANQ